eukprot:5827485-Pyramimonas_sp.AAC.1
MSISSDDEEQRPELYHLAAPHLGLDLPNRNALIEGPAAPWPLPCPQEDPLPRWAPDYIEMPLPAQQAR